MPSVRDRSLRGIWRLRRVPTERVDVRSGGPSQYKDYVLTLLFMKYVSDKYAGSDDFADITVPPGGSFADMVALKGTKEIGDGINKVIGGLADANDYLLKGVIDQADFNDESRLGRGKEMQDRLSKLVGIFEGLGFRANRAHGDDLLGDAYEYLMRHFATQSGKSKGQFYTPAEVSRIMAQVIGIGPDSKRDYTVYDPTCGSGSLLIKAADEAPRAYPTPLRLSFLIPATSPPIPLLVGPHIRVRPGRLPRTESWTTWGRSLSGAVHHRTPARIAALTR